MKVAVWVGVKVDVVVGVKVAVCVAVKVGVEVEVKVAVTVGVAVAADTVCRFPATVPPVRIAACPVVCPLAVIPVVARLFEKFLLANPDMLRSNTSRNVCGAPDARGAVTPFTFWNVTDPVASKLWPPISSVSVPAVYSPFPEASWYSLTLPVTTSVVQPRLPPPVNASCFTNTFSLAVDVRMNCRLDTLVWLNK